MGFSSTNSICYLHKYAPQGVLEHLDHWSALKARKFVIFQWYIPQTLFSLWTIAWGFLGRKPLHLKVLDCEKFRVCLWWIFTQVIGSSPHNPGARTQEYWRINPNGCPVEPPWTSRWKRAIIPHYSDVFSELKYSSSNGASFPLAENSGRWRWLLE